MLTIFSTPKPFRSHINVIQRNAIQSWKRLHPDVEIILLGDEEGAAQVSSELRLTHVPDVARNTNGTKYLSSIFDRAQEMARHDLLCYVNCDIILLGDFRVALARVSAWSPDLLMIGRRWDMDLTEPIDFSAPQAEQQIRDAAMREGRQRPAQWIDYFAFRRGLYQRNIPPFVIGRPGWDNWLVWKARASGARVVDASEVVTAVHQNHDYSYHPEGREGVWQGEEAQANYALLENGAHFRTIDNATHRLTPRGFRRNYRHWLRMSQRATKAARYSVWFGLLDATRPLRHKLGLRQNRPASAERNP
jgi:hypothetical protein